MAIFTGIAAAVTAISGWIGGLGAFGAFALKTAVGLGLSYAAQALAGKPKSEERKFSINTDLKGGGALSRSIILGRAATGGSLVWANTWGSSNGSPNAWLTQVIALSDIPVRGLVELWVDGKKVTINPANNNATIYGQSVPEYEKDGPNLYVKFYDGNQTTADPTLVSTDTTADRAWSADRVGRGVAYVIMRSRSSKGLFSGIPSFTFVVDGARLYDPSRDSTNGGVGSQRYLQPETWGGDGDDLPVVQIYNLMRGIYYNGSWLYGFQSMSGARLPGANWAAQIQKCRATIIEATGPQPTYRAGGEISLDAPLSVAMEEFLSACQGKVAEAGGIYTIYVGEPDAPLFAITDDDIISTEEQSFTPFYGLADSFNGVSATYPEPLEAYAEKTAPPIHRPDLEALDGNRRLLANIQFTFVPYSEQVQRLMKSHLLASLRYRRHTITLPPRFWRFAVPGETLRFTSDRNGYNAKLFVIEGVVDKANLDVTVDIIEYDPNDYDWNSEVEFQPPVIGALGPILPTPRSVIDPFAEPYTMVDEAGNNRRPAIRIVWDRNPDVINGVTAVQWEIRFFGRTALELTGSTDHPEIGSAIVSAGILPNTRYEVRLRFLGGEGEPDGNWSGWFSVLTPDVRLGIYDIEVRLETIQEDAKAVWKELGKELDDVWKRLEHISQAESLSSAAGQISRNEIRKDIGTASARVSEEIQVRASETAALASRSLQVEASVADNAARILVEEVARADGDTALASQVTAVRAEIDAGFAEGMVRFDAVAAPGNITARYALLIRATLNDTFRESGFYVEIYTEGGVLKSRFGVLAEQFVVSNGTTGFLPMVFENGELKLQIANIGSVRTADINLGNGKVIINQNGIIVSS